MPIFDIRFDGEFAQLKQPNSSEANVLRHQLDRAKKQNDNLIVIVKYFEDEEVSVGLAREWLFRNPNKKLRVLNLKTNKFYEVKK